MVGSPQQIPINNKGLVYSVVLLLASVFLTVGKKTPTYLYNFVYINIYSIHTVYIYIKSHIIHTIYYIYTSYLSIKT